MITPKITIDKIDNYLIHIFSYASHSIDKSNSSHNMPATSLHIILLAKKAIHEGTIKYYINIIMFKILSNIFGIIFMVSILLYLFLS